MSAPDRVGHYRVVERLGRGSMAEVFAGYDEQVHRAVVLKVIDPGLVADDTASRAFVREVRAAMAVSHPYLCALHDVLEREGCPIVVMDRIHGPTIRELSSKGALDARDVCRFGRELAEALAAAHARGVLHRNISASNVMIAADGHARLMDLGLAHVAVSGAPPFASDPRIDVPSRTMMVGTPVYMAPELLHGGPPTMKSDLYAVGVVLYRMATGVMPFAERITPDSLAEILLQPPVPPGLLVAGVPPSLERAIMGLLEKKPDARFPSAESLAATLSVPVRSDRS
ncbi:MAG: serine/threonine-protein kinase [Vicinamibacterales bacterium]